MREGDAVLTVVWRVRSGWIAAMTAPPASAAAIYNVILAIPPGRVATYGQVAALAGLPRGHRQVATALRYAPAELELPWQRVVGKQRRNWAKISIADTEGAKRQANLLRAEGVELQAGLRISLQRFGWLELELEELPV